MEKDKELILKDFCARLPYGVIVNIPDAYHNGFKAYIKAINPERELVYYEVFNSKSPLFDRGILGIKPYLRPMSSMTKEEVEEFNNIPSTKNYQIVNGDLPWDVANYKQLDFLNAHHLDYRGLIPMDLAIEAPKGMYDYYRTL